MRFTKTGALLSAALLLGISALTPLALRSEQDSAVADGEPSDRTSSASGLDQKWAVLVMNGQRIGYVHATTRERAGEDGRTIIASDALTHMKLVRFGQSLVMKQMLHMEETSEGRLLRFTSVVENPPASRITATGLVAGDRLTLTARAAGNETESVLEGMQEILSPSWPERYLAENELAEGEEVRFDVFEPQLARKATVTLKRKPDAATRLLDGRQGTFQNVLMTQTFAGVPPIESDLFLDGSGEAVKLVTHLLGLEAYYTTEEEARKELRGEIDLAVDTLVRVNAIEAPHQAEQITYRVRVDGGNPRALFAEGPTQRLEPVDENETKLIVRSLRPASVSGGQDGEEVAEEYRQATRFLEADADLIRQLARRAAGAATEPAAVAVALERFVGEFVREKNFSTAMATALEVARSREGDCTEHAVLLAALLRARGIPSRVAIGFVYSGEHSAFAGHMWTEASLGGKWIPLDATLSQGGIGAGHIKVSDSSLSDAGNAPVAEFLPLIHLLGRTTIEVLERR